MQRSFCSQWKVRHFSNPLSAHGVDVGPTSNVRGTPRKRQSLREFDPNGRELFFGNGGPCQSGHLIHVQELFIGKGGFCLSGNLCRHRGWRSEGSPRPARAGSSGDPRSLNRSVQDAAAENNTAHITPLLRRHARMCPMGNGGAQPRDRGAGRFLVDRLAEGQCSYQRKTVFPSVFATTWTFQVS